MKIEFKRVHHVHISIPKGEELRAREFYCAILGLKEIPKPVSLLKNGGLWLEIGNIQLHVGIEDLQEPSQRHFAMEVENLQEIKEYLISKNVRITNHTEIANVNRFSLYDYWENRIELMELKKNPL